MVVNKPGTPGNLNPYSAKLRQLVMPFNDYGRTNPIKLFSSCHAIFHRFQLALTRKSIYPGANKVFIASGTASMNCLSIVNAPLAAELSRNYNNFNVIK